MVIHLATDHAGFEHKQKVCEWLESEGYAVVDHGAYVFNENDDYPDFIAKAAIAVQKVTEDKAIIFGGSGEGEAMMANRFSGVRAAVLNSDSADIAILSRQHNDANVLSIGARFVSVDAVKKHVWTWLHTEAFTDEKYIRRNEKLDTLSK